jgi:hypothetical protein
LFESRYPHTLCEELSVLRSAEQGVPAAFG